MTPFVILIDPNSTTIRKACQAAHVPYVSVSTGFDLLVDEAIALVRALAPREEAKRDDIHTSATGMM